MKISVAQSPSGNFKIVTSTGGITPNQLTIPRDLPKRRIYVLADGAACVVLGTIQLLLGGQVIYEVPYQNDRVTGTQLSICGGFGTYDANTPDALFGDFPTGGPFSVAPWHVLAVADMLQFSGSGQGVTTWILACHSETIV